MVEPMYNMNNKCCDNCIYYHWYEDRCEKYECETDARSVCSSYISRNNNKGDINNGFRKESC